MINDRLNMPDHYIGTTNGFLAQWLFEDMQARKKGTFAWDFVRYLFEMEDVEEEKYMKQFKELFNTAFLSEESCKEWIDTKIIPLVKNVDYSITCYINENKWKFKLFRPAKFRDYHNHQNVFVPTLIMEDSDGLMAAFATSAAFDAYDSYEDLVKIENFSGIIKGDKAITGEALYKSLLEKYKKSNKDRIKYQALRTRTEKSLSTSSIFLKSTASTESISTNSRKSRTTTCSDYRSHTTTMTVSSILNRPSSLR